MIVSSQSILLVVCVMIYLVGVIFSLCGKARYLQFRLQVEEMWAQELERSLIRLLSDAFEKRASEFLFTAGENSKPDGF